MRSLCSIAAVVLLFVASNCGPGSPAGEPAAFSPTLAAVPLDRFTLGIEYAVPGLAQAYADTGVTSIRLTPAYGVWGNVEPEQGHYVWDPLDAVVLEYQDAGFSGMQLVLSAESPWASVSPPQGVGIGDALPKEAYWEDYAAFVRRTVERYDGDGVDDAPGLRYPIHRYGVERQFSPFWPGSAEGYVRLLRAAYREIHTADPAASISLVSILVRDAFNGPADAAEVERRLQRTPTFRHSLADIRTVLAACDSYDVVDLDSLGDYTEIPPTVAWLRGELERADCDRPIWIGNAFGMSPLVGDGDPFSFIDPLPYAPTTAATRDMAVAVLQSAADPQAPNHDAVIAWLRAEMARGLVKKVVVAAGAGLSGINVGNLEDWSAVGAPELDAAAVRAMGAAVFMGMIDTALTTRYAGGPLRGGYTATSHLRESGDRRPALYALELVVDALDGYTAVEKLDLGAGVWAYRLYHPARSVWVLWYDDGRLHLPGDPLPTMAVDLFVDAEQARVTTTPITAQRSDAQVLEPVAGNLRLILDGTPLFVEVAE